MAEASQESQSPSAEAQELMAELRSEGHSFVGDPEPTADPVAPEAKEAEAPAEDEGKPEPEKAADPEPEDDKRTEETKEERTERQPRYVPVSKHNEERHKRQDAERKAQEAEARYLELKAEIEGLKARPQNPRQETVPVKERISQLADKYGVDPSFASDLAESLMEGVRSANQLPQDIVSRLERFEAAQAEAAQRELATKQELFFEKEFGEAAKDFPGIAARKEELKQIAFSEEGSKVPLRYLVLDYVHRNPDAGAPQGRRAAETSSPMSRERRPDAESDDFANVTPERLERMSDAEADRYFEWVKQNKIR